MRRQLAISLLVASCVLVPHVVRADDAADRKAEIERKKEEARKKAEERKAKAAADKAAAGGAASTGTGGTSSAGAATTATGGTAGKSSAGGAGGSAGAGGKSTGGAAGAGGKAGTGGTAGAGGATTKVEEKSVPLPTADIESLRKDRPERRKATVARLRERWGSLLVSDAGIADLKQHARRVAYLQRVRAVADVKKDAKTVEAVDVLLTREDERHSRAMNALREGALPAGGKP